MYLISKLQANYEQQISEKEDKNKGETRVLQGRIRWRDFDTTQE